MTFLRFVSKQLAGLARLNVVVGFVALILFGSASYAAESAGLQVLVVDGVNSRPLTSVEAKVSDRDGRVLYSQQGENGKIVFIDLPPGLYEVSVHAAGYQAIRIPSIRLVIDKVNLQKIRLQPLKDQVEEILVVGQQVNQSELNSVGTSFIDREALRSAAGSGSDVLRALDGMPGLFAAGEYSSYTVRGNGPRGNMILVDGIPFDNVVHFSDAFGEQEELEGGGRYSVFAPNVIAGAEFFPGGWSSAYGGKSGSLLKLEVAEGNSESASYTARLDLAGVELGYDGPSYFHRDTSVLFSARNYNFGRLFKTIGLDDIGTPKLTDIIWKSTTQLSGGGKFNVLAIYAPESYERGIDNVLASDDDSPGEYEDVDVVSMDKENVLISTAWSHFIGRQGKLENRLYVRKFDESTMSGEAYPDLASEGASAADIPLQEDILFSNRQERELGWRLDYENENTLGLYRTGLRVAQLDMDFRLRLNIERWNRFIFESSDFRADPEQKYIVLTPELVNTVYNEKATNASVYFDQQVFLGPFDVRAGLRYDRDGFADENTVSPRFALTLPMGSQARLTLTGGRYYQAPRFVDRASDPSNNALQNEVYDQISLGIQYSLAEGVNLFVEPYYQEMSRLIVNKDGPDQTYGNLGTGQSSGVDIAIGRAFSNGWSADFKYSYNQATIKNSPTATKYDADFNRPHSYSVGGVWEINERWKISSRWKWASGRPMNDFIVHENVLGDDEPLRFSKEITQRNVARFGDYSSLNLRVDYLRSVAGVNIIAFLDVINLLGSDNPNTLDFNERIGRDMPEEGDAVPIIGFRVEW